MTRQEFSSAAWVGHLIVDVSGDLAYKLITTSMLCCPCTVPDNDLQLSVGRLNYRSWSRVLSVVANHLQVKRDRISNFACNRIFHKHFTRDTFTDSNSQRRMMLSITFIIIIIEKCRIRRC